MMKRIFLILTIISSFVACADNDSFSVSSGLSLDFSSDTITLDTLFSRTSSSTYTFWVHNRRHEGIRVHNIRLKRGNQTGFRVNVDGMFLDNSNGSQVSDIEIRKNDSILVFVEITPFETYQLGAQLISDQLVFSLESGIEQSVVLQAWAWDAVKCYSPIIESDTIIESDKPLLIDGDMIIKEGASLTIRNTTLYFHAGSGIEVYGNLQTENCIMRGDRLDRMFSYLPYDRIPGQWKGVKFYGTSDGNMLNNTQIRNSSMGVFCDSAALDTVHYRLQMKQCVVHNTQGNGVTLNHAHALLENCLLSNSQGDCLHVDGGIVEIQYCTIAQFYPFSGGRGSALYFINKLSPLTRLLCDGAIITGYDDDVVMGEPLKQEQTFNYSFSNSLLRTPVVTDDSEHFVNIIWESSNDSIQGKNHFIKIDEDNLDYDFHLNSLSTAVGLGCYR